MDQDETSEAARLERLWSGDFGDSYVERNAGAGEGRGKFWNSLLDRYPARRILEVGSNVGANLRHITGEGREVWGIDVNKKALAQLHERLPDVGGGWGVARDLPFRDRRFDLVFTVGVLIHQPEDALPIAISELVRCSRRWVLAVEYVAEDTLAVDYRGQRDAFFKRDYGRIFQSLFPDLALVETGALSKAEGFDDGTAYWLFDTTSV